MSAWARRSETGETLLEILIAVVVVSVGFLAVLGGLGTSFALSAFHREQARAEAELRRYAEAAKGVSYSTACPAVYSKATMAFTAAADFTADEPVVVGYVDPSTGLSSPTCTPATPRLHLVRLQVTSNVDTRAVEAIDVVKRPT